MNISLIGMMGCGKTTVGRLLAERLKFFDFIDTDDEIVKLTGKSINEIFENDGEKVFRQIEKSVLEKILQNDNQIISTGGGIVINEENINNLSDKSKVIYLKADADELYRRIKNTNNRPLLNTDEVKNKIEKLLQERESNYNKAHLIIDTFNKTPDIIADEIIEKAVLWKKQK